MKLYDFGPAVNAQRVRVFLAEKGLEIPTEQLNVREDNQFVEPFTSMNPFHCVPFLELDDGTVIAESVSSCRYLEELHPEPALFGGTAEERAVVDMWLRRFELDGFMPLLHAVRNHVPMFAGRVVPGTRTILAPDEPDEFFAKPPAIAEEMYHVAHQDRSTWSFQVELRPFGENW